MKPMVILVCSISAVGHTNACVGATRPFLKRGHRVVLLLEESYRGKFSPLGFEECIYRKAGGQPDARSQSEVWEKAILDYRMMGPETAEEKLVNLRRFYATPLYQNEFAQFNEAIHAALEMYKPDLIWLDSITTPPAVYYSEIKWVKNVSVSPILFEIDEDLPPGGTGWPTEGDRSKWASFNASVKDPLIRSSSTNDLIESLGYDRYPDDLKAPGGQCLTVYAYPEELNYMAIRKKGWFNLEVFEKPSKFPEYPELSTLVPAEFLDNTLDGKFSGKLIYLSMGTFGSLDLTLMRRLVEVLGKTKHKYIVAMGSRAEEYSLPANMYGSRSLPQTSILPHVDLVITHGGNSTVTETFIEGKPMVVLPLLVDQFDNAQRLAETRFGLRVDANRFTDEELINACNRLLYNEDLERRLQFAAKRIRSSARHDEMILKVEEIIEKSKRKSSFFDFL